MRLDQAIARAMETGCSLIREAARFDFREGQWMALWYPGDPWTPHAFDEGDILATDWQCSDGYQPDSHADQLDALRADHDELLELLRQARPLIARIVDVKVYRPVLEAIKDRLSAAPEWKRDAALSPLPGSELGTGLGGTPPDEPPIVRARVTERIPPRCEDNSPAGYTGHWRDWHRGHGCEKDPEAKKDQPTGPLSSEPGLRTGQTPTFGSLLSAPSYGLNDPRPYTLGPYCEVCGRAAPFGCCTRRKDAAPLKGESPIWSVLFKVHECVSRDYLPGSKLRAEMREALNRCPKCGFGLSIDGRGSWLCQGCGAAHLRDDEDAPRVASAVVDESDVEARVVEQIAAWLRVVIPEHRHPTALAYCYVDTEILAERLRAGDWRRFSPTGEGGSEP